MASTLGQVYDGLQWGYIAVFMASAPSVPPRKVLCNVLTIPDRAYFKQYRNAKSAMPLSKVLATRSILEAHVLCKGCVEYTHVSR